jgi:hypothetical protein
MERLDKAINWKKIESILLSHYIPGTNSEGAGAYHPMLLYKCLLLQKWFRLSSDPELENRSNQAIIFSIALYTADILSNRL